MAKKEFVGLTLDGNLLKVARIRKQKKKWKLTTLNRITIKDESRKEKSKSRSKELVKNYNQDEHFGIDQDFEDENHTNGFEFLPDSGNSNENISGYNSDVQSLRFALNELDSKKLRIGISVRSGDTSFQVLKNKNYKEVKKKRLKKLIEEHLKKVYGAVPHEDFYRYIVRDDGSMLLISYQEKPYLLKLLDSVRHSYSGKMKIIQMIPDECILANLIGKHYPLGKDEITCVVNVGNNRSRVFFMKGEQIIHALAPIEEGRDDDQVLDVIFSKILFQLDTGEVPGLDRVLITNDTSEESVEFFKKQFPDLEVNEFRFSDDSLITSEKLEPITGFFTSSIGAALSAANTKDADIDKYSMLPGYVLERQNIMKLRWHGVLLLLLLMATPMVWNQIYQDKGEQIQNLEEQLVRTEHGINTLEPVVVEMEQLQALYAVEAEKRDLLASLGGGATYWSETLKTLNDGLSGIESTWIDRIQYGEDGFTLQGYSMLREQIPTVTNLFSRADLQAVSVVEMRDRRLYRFTIKVYYGFNPNITEGFASREN